MDKVAQLIKMAGEVLKQNERRGTLGDAFKVGLMGGAGAGSGFEAAYHLSHGTKFKHLPGPVATSALIGAALGGTLGVGVGSLRAGVRKLMGNTSISHAEYTRRKKEAANGN